MALRVFSPSFKLTVAQVKQQPDSFVRACRTVLADPGQSFSIRRQESDPVAALSLIDYGYFQGLINALDPSLSKPVVLNTINLQAVAAAIRFDEVYRLASGESEFPGSDPNGSPGNLAKSGFELKIHEEGTRQVIEQETALTSSNVVQVSHPVVSTEDVAAEDTGGSLQVAGTGGTAASLTVQDITYQSVVGAASANNITIQNADYTPAVPAQLMFQGVHIVANTAGTGGNAVTMATTAGATFGAEAITVVGSAISIQIAVGQTNAAIVANLLTTYGPAAAIVSANTATPLQTQIVQGATHLGGGLAAVGLAGAEVVTVSGDAITIKLQSGVSTATQVLAKVNASGSALALISAAITGTPSNPQVVSPAQNLQDGKDAAPAMQLGDIQLSDNGSSIPDGTSVNIAYPSQSYTVYQIQITRSQQAIVARTDLINYLFDNGL